MKRLLATALLVCVVVTGCGGGSKSNSLGSGPTSTPSVPTLPTDLPSNLPSSAASIIAGLSTSQCQQIALDFSKASSIFSTADPSTPYSDRFKAISTAFHNAANDIDKPDVKAAMQKLADIYGSVGKAMEGVDYKPGSGTVPPAAYLTAIKSFGDPAFRSASTTMSAYFSGGCKG